MARTAVVAGVGPGLGASVARRFHDEGCAVGLFARSADTIEALADDLGERALAVTTDVSDPDDVREGFDHVREAFGPVDVLVVNASAAPWKGTLEIGHGEFDRALGVNVRGGLHCAQEAVPDMLDGEGGTVIFTGATTSVRGLEGGVGFSAAKFAARGLAQSMAQELASDGVHVAHVVIDGQIRPPDRAVEEPDDYLDPDAIADRYWRLVDGDVATMDFEVHVTNGNGDIEFV